MKYGIPPECLIYTDAFQTMRWEQFIILIIGVVIGMLVVHLGEK